MRQTSTKNERIDVTSGSLRGASTNRTEPPPPPLHVFINDKSFFSLNLQDVHVIIQKLFT